MAKVLITGGTGLIGRSLSKKLSESGHEVALLTRSKAEPGPIPKFHWDYKNGEIDEGALGYCDSIIHLAGVNIGAGRWTPGRKKEILDSRVGSAGFILEKLKEKQIIPEAFISASGISYYGAMTSERIFVENDDPGEDFIGNICIEWEKAADQFAALGTRVVKLRTGIVLDSEEGALEKMLTPYKFRLKAVLGDGKQFFPWIHREDICGMYLKAIEDHEMQGAYNAVASEQLTYADIIDDLSLMMKRTLFSMNVPSFVMKIIFGEMSDILLKGSRASNEKIVDAGYKFDYPSINRALKNILEKEDIN